jgi:DNA-binding CsgD family transcriptional regulator
VTCKQREIVRLVALGFSGAEIARLLRMSEGAVRGRLSRAYRHTGARSQAGLVGWCVAHGVVTVEDLQKAYCGGEVGQGAKRES